MLTKYERGILMKRTALYDEHVRCGGRMIDFGGWELPVQYKGILEEHEAVRTAAGLFDVSHMGEVTVEGKGAEDFIQNLVTNDISHMTDFQVLYTPMCYPDGGVVDDLLVYRYSAEKYLLVINASNVEKDFEWMKAQEFNFLETRKSSFKNGIDTTNGLLEIVNVSEDYAQLALQGPLAEKILQTLTADDLQTINFFHFRDSVHIQGIPALVSRTGYTGEDGFEIYLSSKDAPVLWNMILDCGRELGLMPAGLGARDTLRLESVLPLYGREISKDISPLEAKLDAFVKLDKEGFIGKEALVQQKKLGTGNMLVGFEMIDRGIPRSHLEVQDAQNEGRTIGFVTTGSYSPTLKKSIGLALIEASFAREGGEIYMNIRGKALKAVIVKIPFYRKRYRK
jgi:aminomethyltransferase